MVTTRSNKVASTMQASSHSLGELSDDESWTMFKQRAFADGGAPETHELIKIGTEIVKRCHGLPLAIQVIGSLMYTKKSENDWLSAENSQLWNIKDDTKRVLETLKLSYDHLPYLLKRCFCFCSIYPNDKVIIKDELIQCWMALGLLQPHSDSDQTMEDVGERHFKTLLSMCLLQDTVKDEFGGIESCKMHDIIHDLALITTETDYSTLKSVAQISSKHVNPQSYLRLLDLNDLGVRVYSIKKLKHLRYLDISKTDLQDLTSSFTACYNLHTIKFRYLYSVSEHLGKLINLRHLCVEYNMYSGKCWLTGIGRLTCLQTLPFFGINREHGCHISELENLNNLRGELLIFGLDDVVNYEEAKSASLSKKQNVCRLCLCWGMPVDFSSDYSYTYQDGDNTELVLEGLEPHSNLEGLTIENFKGSNFPQWMMVESHVLGNLVNLKLHNCDKCERIPPLGHLQRLKVVKIISLSNVKEIGLEFYGSSIGRGGVPLFPVLRELVLRKMPKLERWLEAVRQSSVSNSPPVFPCLEKLDIDGCPNLESFPSHFMHLEMLDIDRCPALKSFPSHIPSLTSLSISDIDSLALKDLSRMPTSLTCMYLRSCRGSEFQSFLEDFLARNKTSLKDLYIRCCDELVSLPDNLVALEVLGIYDCKNLTDIQHCLPSARSIHISGCSKLIGLPSLSQVFPVMESLSLDGCNELVNLPDIRSHTYLQQLIIEGLEKLTSVPELCKSLRALHISDCRRLTSLPEELGKTLRKLSLFGCDSLVSFPDFQYLRRLDLSYKYGSTEERGPSDLSFPFSSEFQCLETLSFGGLPELKSLPDQIQHLNALKTLNLSNLDSIESLPDWLGNLTSLQTLDINWCEKLKYFPSAEAMKRLINLSRLEICSCSELKSLPDQIQHLKALKTFQLEDLDGVEWIPDWLGNLTSLETLDINSCEKLKYLPSVEAMRRLINLTILKIGSCPLLEKRCTKCFRPEWRKISHIPNIVWTQMRSEDILEAYLNIHSYEDKYSF